MAAPTNTPNSSLTFLPSSDVSLSQMSTEIVETPGVPTDLPLAPSATLGRPAECAALIISLAIHIAVAAIELAAVVYGTRLASRELKLNTWTARKDYQDQCRGLKAAGNTSLACEKALNNTLPPPPIVERLRVKRSLSPFPTVSETHEIWSQVTRNSLIIILFLIGFIILALVIVKGKKQSWSTSKVFRHDNPELQHQRMPHPDSDATSDTNPGTARASEGMRRRKPDSNTLGEAVARGDIQEVRRLLEKGVSVDACDKAGWTPLQVAAREGHEPVARLLLEKNAEIDIADMYGWTALHVAARYGSESIVRLLLERGADFKKTKFDRQSPLHVAAEHGQEPVVRLLLEKDVDVEAKDLRNLTPLEAADRQGHHDLVRLMESAGARRSKV